ncbi:MAG: MBL fold metallo-hydrolase, partial [Gammaproteobacteria bacterium]
MATFAGAIGGSTQSAASGTTENKFVEQLAEGVYLHRGQHAGLEDENRGDSANIGFIVGDRCVAVIDSGGAISTGKKLYSAIKSITDKAVCYVINTHVHFDHVLGNAAFLGAKPEFVGHKNLAESISGNRAFFVEQFSAELGSSDEALVIGPTMLVEEQETIDLGNRQLLLRAAKPAHTDADLSVLDIKTNLLWTGDLVFRERMPILDASLKGWLSWLDG